MKRKWCWWWARACLAWYVARQWQSTRIRNGKLNQVYYIYCYKEENDYNTERFLAPLCQRLQLYSSMTFYCREVILLFFLLQSNIQPCICIHDTTSSFLSQPDWKLFHNLLLFIHQCIFGKGWIRCGRSTSTTQDLYLICDWLIELVKWVNVG